MSIDLFDQNADLDHETKPVKLCQLEIITGPQRRRTWPREEQLKIVVQSCSAGVVASEVAAAWSAAAAVVRPAQSVSKK